MSKPKILAMYLPQYHEIEENNKWWGKGHTEWTSCKKAKPLFEGHNQPRIPLNNNYYDLSSTKAQKWQAEIAQKYGVYGFCYYHYWFEGHMMMEKPAENMLKDKTIDLPFCFSWANHTWHHSLSKTKKEILIEQTYGGKDDVENHYNYLVKFFKDERYIKINNKPVFVIYSIVDLEDWDLINKIWNEKAKNDGFDGMYFIATLTREGHSEYANKMHFDAQMEYQPRFALNATKKIDYTFYYYIKKKLYDKYINKPCILRYDKVWNRIIKNKCYKKSKIPTYLGSYCDWDTTARWAPNGEIHIGACPEKFEKYFEQQYKISKQLGNEFIFITAWNEWSEGAYLEPDTKNKYAYLESIKEVVEKI